MNRTGWTGLCVVGFALAAWAGSCDVMSTSALDREAALRGEASGVILPGYEAMTTRAQALSDALTGLCAAPSVEGLEAARAAWRGARVAWKETAAFRLGPAVSQRTNIAVDWMSTSPDRIEAVIAGDEALTDALIDAAPADTRGLPALELLLFETEATLTEPRRCEYAAVTARSTARAIDLLQVEWREDGGDFVGVFTMRREGMYVDARAAVGDIANAMIFAVEDVTAMYLAPALGLDGEAPSPERLIAHRSGHTLNDMKAMLRSAQRVYLGGDPGSHGEGIDDMVRDRRGEVDDRIQAHFVTARAALDAIDVPIAEALQSQPERLQAAFDAIKDLQASLEGEMGPLLGVSLAFNDNDGD